MRYARNDLREEVFVAGLGVLGALLIGVSIGFWPVVTVGGAVLCASTFLLIARRVPFDWSLVLAALTGSLILAYGFANVGLRVFGVPIPLAEILLFLLAVSIAVARPGVWPPREIVVLSACLIVLGGLRLIIDVPRWGQDALRDATLLFESAFLFVGYRACRVYGVERWVRSLRWIFLACLVYFALYGWKESIAAISPVVGLRRPVPLLGNYDSAGPAAIAGLLFFAFVRPFGWWSCIPAAGFLPVIVLMQSRGLYVAMALSLGLLWFLGKRDQRRGWAGLIGSFTIGAVMVAALFIAAPEGRLGPVNLGFVIEHLSTLGGHDGPGAGSLWHRVRWFHEAMELVGQERGGWLVGIGFGPDLIGGFQVAEGVYVRKPHNDYLEIFARVGLAGLVVFGTLLAVSLLQIIRSARSTTAESQSAFLWWVAATVTVYLAVAAFQPLLAFPYGTVPLFTLLGAGLAIASMPVLAVGREGVAGSQRVLKGGYRGEGRGADSMLEGHHSPTTREPALPSGRGRAGTQEPGSRDPGIGWVGA